MLTYCQEFRDTHSPWVLYKNGTLVHEFVWRWELLEYCELLKLAVKWIPLWVRPNTGRIVGAPFTVVPNDPNPFYRREDFP